MKLNDFKEVITKHFNRLINEWFNDIPLIQALAKTIIKANINKYDNLLELLTDENGDILVDELINNLNIRNGYEIDLTTISPLLPNRIIVLSKSDIDAILNEITK